MHAIKNAGEAQLAAALEPYGWTCTEEFWFRYYTDRWVFTLANAVEDLTRRLADAEADDDRLAAELNRHGYGDDRFTRPGYRDPGVVMALAAHEEAVAQR